MSFSMSGDKAEWVAVRFFSGGWNETHQNVLSSLSPGNPQQQPASHIHNSSSSLHYLKGKNNTQFSIVNLSHVARH